MNRHLVAPALLSALLVASAGVQAQAQPQGTNRMGIHSLPPGPGEASTLVGGQPNGNPEDPRLLRSPQALQAEREEKKATRQAARDARRTQREEGRLR